jgi:putative ABC transport system permease protein
MLKNYFITALRFINRYKAYSIINVLGLALGIASCLIIFLVVRYELSYDRFNEKADRTYRITLHALDFNPAVSMAVVPAMRNDFPELERVSQVWQRSSGLIKVGQARFAEKNYLFADEQLPYVFDYQWLAGDRKTALAAPNSVVLTEKIAHKYFGEADPMGQVINLDNQYNLKVTGIIKDLPGNTHLGFLFMVSFATIRNDIKGMMTNFYSIANGSFAYLVIPKDYSIEKIRNRIKPFIIKNWGADIAKEATLILQPVLDIHFDQRYLNDTISQTTSKNTYWALAAVAVLIIIIACINFINLATAQAIRRAKEVGVRKVLGSSRAQLIGQFLGETSILVLLSLLFGIIITVLFLPLAEKWLDIHINARLLAQPEVIGLLGSIIIAVILLAGLYPAFVQSAFRPVESLKSKTAVSFQGLGLRKSLVIIQFAISQILIVGTLVVAYQMNFFQNQDLGFNKEAVISFNVPDQTKTEVLRKQLEDNPGVKEICFSSAAPVFNDQFTNFNAPEYGITKDDVTEVKFIDERYTDMFALKMLAGEKIIKTPAKDTANNAVVNQAMIQKLGFQDPHQAIGKHFYFNGRTPATIMGVVQDFQSESKHKKIRPCILIYEADNFYCASVRIQPRGMNQTIARIDKSWSSLFPNDLFSYEFLDDHIANWYRQEQKEYTAFRLFSVVAILIGCLGLYGLVAFAAAQRIKEVGIRKVLGASLPDIVFLFAKEFIVLIAIAFLIAAPVAYYFMNNWLNNFAYRISISGWLFLIAILVSVLIAAFTIAYQAFRAGRVNPVKSLRME